MAPRNRAKSKSLRYMRRISITALPGIDGRPWRVGVTNVALGAAGVPAVIDRRGHPDLFGRKLETTDVAFADALTAAAALIRPLESDLFR